MRRKKRPDLPVTVADLKAFLDKFPDDMKVGIRSGGGRFTGFTEVEVYNLTTYGSASDRLTMETSRGATIFKGYKGKISAPFDALIFD
ncbi:hypothetical protein D869_gp199 [Caulobacter phage CcrRogue]|uniref:Uncharacterized protein n=1 Tax=Caulobacter phage CcrRogue TaxID=2927986 RepID=K4JR00_9CAUD|nr:hypothetical protein D869_gp199 [Caulobacter phage CcrRogue]AFU86715.1 hypothetical protein CcrRogue_gp233 [Caulobacter phage CcrRogue]